MGGPPGTACSPASGSQSNVASSICFPRQSSESAAKLRTQFVPSALANWMSVMCWALAHPAAAAVASVAGKANASRHFLHIGRRTLLLVACGPKKPFKINELKVLRGAGIAVA